MVGVEYKRYIRPDDATNRRRRGATCDIHKAVSFIPVDVRWCMVEVEVVVVRCVTARRWVVGCGGCKCVCSIDSFLRVRSMQLLCSLLVLVLLVLELLLMWRCVGWGAGGGAEH